MKRMLVIAALFTIICAASAGAATPAWFWVWRGTGDPSAMPDVAGLDPAQGGQENVVWYTGSLTQLGTGNWWDIQNDPTYGDVTLIHHSPGADRFDDGNFNWHTQDAPTGVHYDGTTIVYCDTHAAWRSAKEINAAIKANVYDPAM